MVGSDVMPADSGSSPHELDDPEVAAAVSPADVAALVDDLASFPLEIERAFVDHSLEALTRPASDGGWGVVENVCHLRDWESVYLERATAMLERDNPRLPAYDDELWPIERDYRGDNPRRALATFRERRAELSSLLASLSSADWRRSGRHQSRGETTILKMVESIHHHDDRHLAQIRDALT